MHHRSAEIRGPVDSSQSPYATLRSLPAGSVVLQRGLLEEWQRANRDVSIRHGYHMLEESGNFHNVRLALGEAEGEYRTPVFMDSDIYKWLEAASFELANAPDGELESLVDDTIELMARAQMPDGYLNTYYQVLMPDKRWTNLAIDHEMYCAGHLFQAAVAHHRTTGKDSLLNIATRFADHIDALFGPEKRPGTPGHPEIEMGLVELYRETGEKRYLDLAGFLVDQRGNGLLGRGRMGAAYFQDHVPVRDASTLSGHAVRQLYLTAGVVDLYLETGEQALFDAMMRQWHDLTAKKLYITAGVGARHEGEAFGEPYELPNDRAYCETCAAIASMMWNWRLLLATGEGRYADLMERTLYNAFLSSVSHDGMHYFYVNPLLSRGAEEEIGRGGHRRTLWHGCACCPPNVMRTLSSLGHYFATAGEASAEIHLYGPMDIALQIGGVGDVRMRVETRYPWDGAIKLTVEEATGSRWRLALRRPGWCEGATVTVNGQSADVATDKGYFVIERAWQPGDVIELDLPMQARLVEAHPAIDPTRGCLAIERGPMVYCLEECDHPDAELSSVEIDEAGSLETLWEPDLASGVVMVQASGYQVDTETWSDHLYRPFGQTDSHSPLELLAVPYFAWANREPGSMQVWIPRHGACSPD